MEVLSTARGEEAMDGNRAANERIARVKKRALTITLYHGSVAKTSNLS